MSGLVVNIQVYEDFEEAVSASGLRRIATRALRVGGAADAARLDVFVADDEAVRDLNERYRGLDETTDVLSFSFTHEGEYQGEREAPEAADGDMDFPVPPGTDRSLGEVIISYPQAERQGELAGHGTERELSILLAHGVLHLLGHDHETPLEATLMKRLETMALHKA